MVSLRQRLLAGEQVVGPGVGDALGAILAEKAGFDFCHMSGYYVAALLGYPDVGLVTMSEMVYQATRICDSVKIPVIIDADNGYGNAINVIRTVREFERAGAVGLHLEDQDLPKKCGHMTGQVLVSTSEMCGKIRAAADARKSEDFLIIARSDAIKTDGIDAAVKRVQAYRKAGADSIMIMAPRSIDDLKRYRDGVEGPLLITIGSWDFKVTVPELKKLGYQIVVYPVTTLRRGIVAAMECLTEIKKTGHIDHAAPRMMSMHDVHHLMGLERIQSYEQRYQTEEAATK